MAHKTFISYKFSEACNVRDKIIDALGENAKFYKGETSDSPDMSDLKTESIKENLKNMIYETSVMIVVISPDMKNSNWIDWEIEYCLKEMKRGDKTSHSNGLVGVIMDIGGYSWFKGERRHTDGCTNH